MENFIEPELEIVCFDDFDIITTSIGPIYPGQTDPVAPKKSRLQHLVEDELEPFDVYDPTDDFFSW